MRDEQILKKVYARIKAAIEKYEKQVQAQTIPQKNTVTHKTQVEDTTSNSKVQNAVHALNSRISYLEELEPLTTKPTKIVQAIIDLQVDMATIRNVPPTTTPVHKDLQPEK